MIKIGESIIIALILVLYCVTYGISECPENTALDPCICENQTSEVIITCNSTSPIKLKNIFTRVSEKIGEGSKDFHEFRLNTNGITEIEDNAFVNITFEIINIFDCPSLDKINSNAFSGSIKDKVKKFQMFNNLKFGNSDGNDIFDALNNLTNIEEIYLHSPKITEIPAGAFQQKTLIKLYLGKNEKDDKAIENIDDKAFTGLKKIEELVIQNQKLKSLTENVFDFEKSDTFLSIKLNNNELNSDSFLNGTFKNTKRPTDLDLSGNQIVYLKEEVFKEFLKEDKKNNITLYDNPIECVSNFHWADDNCIAPRITLDKTINCFNNTNFSECNSASAIHFQIFYCIITVVIFFLN